VEILATILGAVRVGESEDTTTNVMLLVYFAVAYPGILFGGGEGFQEIQLRTEDKENEDLGAVAP
jgi:hypothetical protein